MPLQTGIIKPGHNCWRKETARSGRFLIDGLAYYCDLFDSLQKAQRQVFILGWDLADQISLGPSPDHSPDPRRLAGLLQKLVELKPDLNIYFLIWDSYPFFLGSRIPISQLKKSFAHPRIHLAPHSHHPYFASFHQKIVVIDDEIAYCGGIDLTANRKDTPHHEATGEVRAPHGRFVPIHDLQLRVEGDAAKALGDLARIEWEQVTNEELSPCEKPDPHSSASFDFSHAPVAISRTQPAYGGLPEIREIEQMILDLIPAAKNLIYIECQYLSSKKITDALCQTLRQPVGPEVIIVSSKDYLGWWEEKTLGSLRQLRREELREADKYQRCGLFYPTHDEPIAIHSKLIVIDDCYALIGSPNLTNRSSGLDFECALVLDATEVPEPKQLGISQLTCRLLCEHLDLNPPTIELWLSERKPLLELITQCQSSERCLKTIPDKPLGPGRRWLAGRKWADPWEGLRMNWALLQKIFPFILLILIGWLLSSRLQSVQWSEVGNSIQEYSPGQISLALLTALLGYGIYSCYDLLARSFFDHPVPKLRTAMIGFVSYAFTLNIGSIIGGAGLRYRLYREAGLKTRQAGQIYVFSVVTNWLGFISLLGLLLSFTDLSLPLEWQVANQTLEWIGPLGVLAGFLYIAACFGAKDRSLRWRSLSFTLPTFKTALLQTGLALGNWLMLAFVLSLLLGEGLAFSNVVFTALVASFAGIIIRVPAGLGVQEAVFLALLGPIHPDHEILAALISYRVLYYFIPLAVAAGFYFYLEASKSRLQLRRARK